MDIAGMTVCRCIIVLREICVFPGIIYRFIGTVVIVGVLYIAHKVTDALVFDICRSRILRAVNIVQIDVLPRFL